MVRRDGNEGGTVNFRGQTERRQRAGAEVEPEGVDAFALLAGVGADVSEQRVGGKSGERSRQMG